MQDLTEVMKEVADRFEASAIAMGISSSALEGVVGGAGGSTFKRYSFGAGTRLSDALLSDNESKKIFQNKFITGMQGINGNYVGELLRTGVGEFADLMSGRKADSSVGYGYNKKEANEILKASLKKTTAILKEVSMHLLM